MSFPSPLDLKTLLPLNTHVSLDIHKNRNTIQKILQGSSPLWALVLGPCSLHNPQMALEYATKIKNLQKKVEKTCLLVMRSHMEKPRSSLGWKGLLYDPYLDGSDQMTQGLQICRKLLLEIAQMQVPMATEFLDPIASAYFSDLISWGFIGARTSSSQIHRQLASHLPMPIGFKNPIDGNIESAIQGALAAQSPHSFFHIDEQGKIQMAKSMGNLYSHIVLRGSFDAPNYDPASLLNAVHLCKKHGLSSRILIDCAHDNSIKKPLDQKIVFQSAVEQYLSGNEQIMGIMMESYLKSGSQSIDSPLLDPSISITDPCLDWDTTEELVLFLHESLLHNSNACLL
ncbi:MAG: 3-deoxy-7-phosphoheptulonate synthase [Rhabdochlamydiaceae bacterium]|nr:3-deoxy-7-phosphoheptulonate synthase [Rhabdochlamydiaceae bacterium]